MSNNRSRTLALLKVLYEKTDENNSLRMSEIIALLEQQGYKCDRRTFYEDKAALIAAGFSENIILHQDKLILQQLNSL